MIGFSCKSNVRYGASWQKTGIAERENKIKDGGNSNGYLIGRNETNIVLSRFFVYKRGEKVF